MTKTMTDVMTKTMTRKEYSSPPLFNKKRGQILIKRRGKQWQKDNKKAAVRAA